MLPNEDDSHEYGTNIMTYTDDDACDEEQGGINDHSDDVINNLDNSNEAQCNGNDTLQSSSYSRNNNNNNHPNYDSKKGLCQPSSRLVKYLCITSIVFVVCALGLAATGLGMLYTSNKNTQLQQEDGGVPTNEEFTPGGIVEESPRFNFTLDEKEFEFVIDPVVDEFVDDEDEEEEEEDGPKAKLEEEGPGGNSPTEDDLLLDDDLEINLTGTFDNEEDILDGLNTPSPTPDPLTLNVTSCLRNSQCDTTLEFCEYELGVCDRKSGVGACTVKPEMCADVHEPVW